MENNKDNQNIGVWYAVVAYVAWGILPLYWKALKKVSSYEILAHRVFWSFIFVALLIIFSGRLKELKNIVSSKRVWLTMLPCALIITVNWGTYIWAVNANHVVEASMGYFINPLFSVLLALIVLKEKLNFWQYVSLVFASIGVAVIAIEYGKLPWIALTLATSFGLYGLFKKMAKIDSIIGLMLETTIIAPVAILFLIFRETQHLGAFGHVGFQEHLLLILSGVATALPLLWFAQAANRIPLSMLGFIQYLSPTISLILGVFLYKEPFTHTHLVSFSFIWFALVLYSFSKTTFMRSLEVGIMKK